MVCKAFYNVGHTDSTTLWESVACTPHDSGQMCGVLAWVRLRRGQVKRLSLQAPEQLSLHQLLPLWGLMTSAFASVESLVSLNFTVAGEVMLAGWVRLMVHLKWLSVRATTISVLDGVGSLTRLQHLHLQAFAHPDGITETISFLPKSIPGSLGELCLAACCLPTLPPGLTAAAASLTRLELSHNVSAAFGQQGPQPGSIAGLALLPQLSALRCLQLRHCRLPWLPRELSELRNLIEVDLSGSLPEDQIPDIARLSRLQHLQRLGLRPAALRRAPGLHQLHTACLSGNPHIDLTMGAWVHTVKQLDIDLCSVATAHKPEALSAMVQLQVLCLCGGSSSAGGADPPVLGDAAVRFLLRGMPVLRLLYLKRGAHRQLTASVEALAQLVALLRERPGLALKEVVEPFGDPFQPRRQTWDAVEVE
ncbi:hypothetical protein N2152v2_000086 [Parachlorella kessleri]